MAMATERTTDAAPVLVFPAGMPRALEYLARCRRQGVAVVGSSSLRFDPAREHYDRWLWLPYVNQPGFDGALGEALAGLGVGGVYTPNPVVWTPLRVALPRIAPGVTLLNDSPVEEMLAGYRAAQARARAVRECPLPLAAAGAEQALPSETELAALFRHVETIPGMCDHSKIAALCTVARHAPRGDLVEIGSWWGKSAFLLAWLARLHGIGRLLCVDPWANAHLVQHDATGQVDTGSAGVDADEALAVFEINLLPYAAGHINYLRLPSVDAARRYREQAVVTTAAFGTTDYEGYIAVLHIDGNHAPEAVSADVDAWTGLVTSCGWIVFDDYIWPFGDGPQRAGDAFLARHREEIACAFVMGGALFVQLA